MASTNDAASRMAINFLWKKNKREATGPGHGSADGGGSDPAPDAMKDRVFGADPFAVLRRRWGVVPAGDDRLSTRDLMELPDDELLATWRRLRDTATIGPAFAVRGWYRRLYSDVLRGKRVLDVGCGLGIDGLTFAEHGAHVTFLDIVEDNLELVRRVARLLGLEAVDFLYMDSLESLSSLPPDFDVMWCQGSLINAPFEVIRTEIQALLGHLPIGGRWIELAYPQSRWIREGRLPFAEWGSNTDGPGTPWVEWYDLEKLQRALRPAEFDTVLCFEFHNGNFNWFDLVRTR